MPQEDWQALLMVKKITCYVIVEIISATIIKEKITEDLGGYMLQLKTRPHQPASEA